MLSPYRDVLALPGATRFSVSGVLARLPISMIGMGIILLLTATGRSYGTAGIVVAAFSLAQAVTGPALSNLVDQHGQRRVMLPLVVLHGTLLSTLAVAATVSSVPTSVLMLLGALVGGTMGSPGALVRARWTSLLGGGRRLHTAFSLESVLDEAVFVLGPVLVTLLATEVSPVLGLLVAAGAGLLGGLVFLSQRSTEPAPTPRAQTSAQRGSLLYNRVLLAVLVAFTATGVLFGSLEVSVIAFADEAGSRSATGVLLASLALASLVAGFVYGAVHWRSSNARRFVLSSCLLGALSAPLLFATSVPVLAGLMVLVGVSVSPLMIGGHALVEETVPAERLTEGFAWLGTALVVGVSMGAAVAGHVVDVAGANRAFSVPVAAALLAGVVAAATWRWLNVAPVRHDTQAGAVPALPAQDRREAETPARH